LRFFKNGSILPPLCIPALNIQDLVKEITE